LVQSRPAAAEVPRVRVLPAMSLAPAADPAPREVFLDRGIPASTDFTMELRLGDLHISPTSEASGVVYVWPSNEQPCKDGFPYSGKKQSYARAMILLGTGADRSLVANLPALQIGQNFCIHIDVHAAISEPELGFVARSAAKSLVSLALKESCQLTASNFAGALSVPLKRLFGNDVGIQKAAEFALAHYGSTHAQRCTEATNASTKLKGDEDGWKKLQKSVQQRLAKLRGYSGLPDRIGEPLVILANGTPSSPSQLITPKTAPDAVREAAMWLEQHAMSGTVAFARWSELLKAFASDMEKAGGDARKQRDAFTRSSSRAKELRQAQLAPLAFWNGTELMALKDLVPSESVISQLATLENFGLLKSTDTKPLRDKLREYVDADAQCSMAAKTVATDTLASKTADQAFEDGLYASMTQDDVRQRISVAVSDLTLANLAGQNSTPNTGNYASVDLGITIAAATGGTSMEFWILPTVGLNLYGTSVDRTIPLSQLTGTTWQQVRQRVGLTVGTSLTAPGLPGRKVNKPIGFGNYPFVGIGVRLTQYLRINGGLTFYDLSDVNPASAGRSLRVAPFLGTSLDADVVEMLTKVVKSP
jgi:hypothetical protein